MCETVWVLYISHEYGSNMGVYRTSERADESLYDYVQRWWDRELPDDEMPEDKQEAIDKYFELNEDEWFDLESIEITEGPIKELSNE
jgi:hypothetical protein